MQLGIRLASRSTLRTLVAVTALLAAGHVVAMILTLGLGYAVPHLGLLDLNEELSFGTVFSVALLLACTALLALLALAVRRRGVRNHATRRGGRGSLRCSCF